MPIDRPCEFVGITTEVERDDLLKSAVIEPSVQEAAHAKLTVIEETNHQLDSDFGLHEVHDPVIEVMTAGTPELPVGALPSAEQVHGNSESERKTIAFIYSMMVIAVVRVFRYVNSLKPCHDKVYNHLQMVEILPQVEKADFSLVKSVTSRSGFYEDVLPAPWPVLDHG